MKKPLIEQLRELTAKKSNRDIAKEVQNNLIRLAVFELKQSAKTFSTGEDEGELAPCVVEYLRNEGLSVVPSGGKGQFYPFYRISWK